ncbi:DUF664 domain-containing protein [Microbispora triticiradicis]|uniref:mycothiol transferase n=1 Tax=Microbispora TaxID=2005 RepID=UPI001ABF37D0|nr:MULTISPECIES: DUF664 domain-containing protein [Microbispora]
MSNHQDVSIHGPAGSATWPRTPSLRAEVGQRPGAEAKAPADVLADYAEVARRTDELVAGLPDLDAAQPLPKAPWHEPGASWSARRVLMHVMAETAQHAGHADIIRESLDGAKSMG